MTMTKNEARELRKMFWQRVLRESHHMPADVPYWVEDLLEISVWLLKVLYKAIKHAVFLTIITVWLYDIDAVLNDFPAADMRFVVNTAFAILTCAIAAGGFGALFSPPPGANKKR